MSNAPSTYQALTDSPGGLESWLLALLRGPAPPAADELLGRLETGAFRISKQREVEPRLEGARLELELELEDPNREAFSISIWIDGTDDLDRIHLEWHGMAEHDIAAALACRWALGLGGRFSSAPLLEFHRQLQLLAALAPDASCFLDVPACRPRPARWLLDAAHRATPPSPENLFCIHAVHDEVEDLVWLHSHGLLRCGSPELEVLSVPAADVPSMGDLLNATAALFLDRGVPESAHSFSVGEGIDLVWLPWEETLRRGLPNGPGGPEDRDDAHRHPSAVLMTPHRSHLPMARRKLTPATSLAPTLAVNPLLYVSADETERMRRAAREAMPRCRRLHRRYATEPGWTFLVKLGFTVRGGQKSDREHLWFEIHTLAGDEVEATLVNQPWGVRGLNEGQRSTQSLDRLTEWTVFSPHGQFGPETIVHLEHELDLLEAGN